jgi:hypothetical protein
MAWMKRVPIPARSFPAPNTRTWTSTRSTAPITRPWNAMTIPISRPGPSSFSHRGFPQVYYVGLLAGENDIELVQQTKNGRDINRHNYTLDEIAVEIQKPVVRRCCGSWSSGTLTALLTAILPSKMRPTTSSNCPGHKHPTGPPFIDLVDYATRIAYFDEEKQAMVNSLPEIIA